MKRIIRNETLETLEDLVVTVDIYLSLRILEY